jgi:hypothetical protein
VLQDLAAFQQNRRTQAEIEADEGRTRPVTPRATDVTRVATFSAVPPLPPPLPPPPLTPRRRTRRPLRVALALVLAVVLLHEGTIWVSANARMAMASFDGSSSDQLLANYDALRERAWFGFSTVRLGNYVAERLERDAIAALRNYRNDDATIRERQFDEARLRLERAIDMGRGRAENRAWLRYAEGHLARISGESKRGAERRADLRAAVAKFEAAARLAPALPDPHIGLARVYSYYMRDRELAERAMVNAERLGQPPGRRGHAQLADLARGDGEQLFAQARTLRDADGEEALLVRARSEFSTAAREYELAEGFAQAARNLRQVRGWLRYIDRRLMDIRAELPQPVTIDTLAFDPTVSAEIRR